MTRATEEEIVELETPLAARDGFWASAHAPLLIIALLQLGVFLLIYFAPVFGWLEPEFILSYGFNADYNLLYELSENRNAADPFEHSYYTFTPTAIVMNAGLTNLSVGTAGIIFAVANILGLLGAFSLSAGMFLKRKELVGALLIGLPSVALSYGMLFQGDRGNLAGIVVFLLTAALFLWKQGNRDFLVGVVIALAGGLSLTPFLLAIPAMIFRRWRILGGIVACAVVIFLVSPNLWLVYATHHLPGWWDYFRWNENAGLAPFFAYVVYGFTSRDISLLLATTVLISVCASVLLPLSLLHISRRGVISEAACAALCLPLLLLLPRTVTPLFLNIVVPVIPVLASLWSSATSRTARRWLLPAIVGAGLMMVQAYALESVTFYTLPMTYLLNLGILLLVFGTLRWSLLSDSEPALSVPGDWKARLPGVATAGALHRLALRHRGQWLPAGLILAVAINVAYQLAGFSDLVLYGWVIAIVLFVAGLSRPGDYAGLLQRYTRRDIRNAAALAILFFPMYLLHVYHVPLQINTDEIIMVGAAQRLAWYSYDPLGLDQFYFHIPSGSIVLMAKICELMGEIDIENFRKVSAAFGLAGAVGSYFLLRLFAPRTIAVCGAVMLGCCHTLIAIARMAFIQIIPVPLGIAALALVYVGYRRQSRGLLAAAGAVAGLGAYGYYGNRFIPMAMLFFIGLCWLRYRRSFSFRAMCGSAAMVLLGYCVVAAPIMIATARLPDQKNHYVRQQVVLYPEGRQFIRDWEKTDSTAYALMQNALRGLTAFNSNQHDGSNLYVNPGFGIIDPLSGVLLWLGVVAIVCRRAKRVSDTLMVGGLLVIWLPMSFLTTKNPAYTRMLVLLPFIFYIVLQGARLSAALIGRLMPVCRARARRVALPLIALAVVAWNARIYYNHIQLGREWGDTVGTTFRFIIDRRDISHYAFYVAADQTHRYYWYGGNGWEGWLGLVKGETQTVEALDPSVLLDPREPLQPMPRPATIFMSGELWKLAAARLQNEFPELRVHPITPPKGQGQVAVELP